MIISIEVIYIEIKWDFFNQLPQYFDKVCNTDEYEHFEGLLW